MDFLARRATGEGDLIQVGADPAPETLARELRALAAGSREYPRAKARLLVLDRDLPSAVRRESDRVQPA